jgi:LysM repeat protein
MDQLRVWLTRLAAPLAFLAAATVLVVVVQRALDEDTSSASTEAVEPTESAPVTIDTGTPEDVPVAERQFYRIRAGDTLEAIAAEFDTTVDRLLELNPGVDSFALQPGTRIRVQ